MSIEIINDDICNADCDIIVNAANGIGFMGGVLGWFIKFSGVSENINYKTKGKVEREACIKCLKHYLIGYMPGNIYVTKGYNLKCKYIFHAVTMWLPGTFSTKRTINKLLPKILDKAKECGALSIAIPLLGTGVGHLIVDPNANVEEEVITKLENERLWRILRTLSQEDLYIVTEYLMKPKEERKTLAEIGKKLGISHTAVRKRKLKVIEYLREIL